MLPSRESFIAVLIRSKLSLRRAYRSWRRNTSSKAWRFLRVPVYEPSSTEDELRTRPRRPAELPAHLPDCDPLPLPLLLGLLYIFAFIIRIWTIAYPPLVVFDEVHFLRFIRAYYYGEYFFDIHPPLGKLVLLFVTRVFCGAPEREFARNGDAFGDQRYVPLRATSAIFGAMLAPLSYLVGREVGLSSWACMFASVAQIVEHLAVVEARLVLLDAQLMAWMATCLLLALRLWGRPPGKRWHLVIGTALTGAAALSVKWTSLATPALVALVSLLGAPFSSQGLHWNEIVVAGSMASSFYVLLFWIHFRLLPKSGQGDAFMRPGFQATLIGSKFYDKYARGPGFWRNFAYLNGVMYVANKGITTRHRWESRWWQWIINQRGLLFYNEAADNEEDDVMEKIYLIVNPAVTVITCIAMVTFMAACMIWLVRKWRRQIPSKKSIERRRMHAFVIRGMFFFCGYLFNLLPFLAVKHGQITNFEEIRISDDEYGQNRGSSMYIPLSLFTRVVLCSVERVQSHRFDPVIAYATHGQHKSNRSGIDSVSDMEAMDLRERFGRTCP